MKTQNHFTILLLLTILASTSSNGISALTADNLRILPGIVQQNAYTHKGIINRLLCKGNMMPMCFFSADNNEIGRSYENVIEKGHNFDGGGFRQEQWHNYPRQLDRLQDYFSARYKDNDNSVLERNDNYKENNGDDEDTNETLDNNDQPRFIVTSDPATEALVNGLDLLKQTDNNIHDSNNGEEEVLTNTLNPAIRMLKMKRETSAINREVADWSSTFQNEDNKMASPKKRLFSLWSRLQSLSHKGHELQHRRHLQAFYNLPEELRSGVLTAETRALMRPPGSPLRWG